MGVRHKKVHHVKRLLLVDLHFQLHPSFKMILKCSCLTSLSCGVSHGREKVWKRGSRFQFAFLLTLGLLNSPANLKVGNRTKKIRRACYGRIGIECLITQNIVLSYKPFMWFFLNIHSLQWKHAHSLFTLTISVLPFQ